MNHADSSPLDDSSSTEILSKNKSEKKLADSSINLSVVIAGIAGKPAAIAHLIEQYHRLVFKIAYSKANNRSDAEDICQDVFLHMHRSLPKLRDPQAFVGWLISLCHNRANRFCRTRQSKRRVLDEAMQRAQLDSEREQRLWSRSEANEDRGVAEIVQKLPEEFRLALQLKYMDGESYETIGEILKMSFHQVDYTLRKAKKALKSELEAREET